MLNGFVLLLAFLINTLGMAWLALSLPANFKKATAHNLNHRHIWRYRLLGYGCLLLALGLCFYVDRPSMASLVIVMLYALSAFMVSMMLGYRAHWLKALKWLD